LTANDAQKHDAPECPRSDQKTLGDGFGISISAAFWDFESFFNKFLGGYSNWRLATINELQGIYDPSVSIPGVYGRGPMALRVMWHVKGNLQLSGGGHWSSTGGNASGEAWDFAFFIGEQYSNRLAVSSSIRALCVRGSGESAAQTPPVVAPISAPARTFTFTSRFAQGIGNTQGTARMMQENQSTNPMLQIWGLGSCLKRDGAAIGALGYTVSSVDPVGTIVTTYRNGSWWAYQTYTITCQYAPP
jgi:hypothetical protein